MGRQLSMTSGPRYHHTASKSSARRPRADRDFSGPGVIVPFLPNVNGYVMVDVMDHSWPDSMGDPKADASTFGAWSMGFFGPLAFPGGLAGTAACGVGTRANRSRGAQGIHPNPNELRFWELTIMHRSCRRITIPLEELTFVNRVALASFTVPGVICYFNPNGEVLKDHTGFYEVWKECGQQEKIPLPLWVNIRFFNLNKELGFMDTVGNGQMEVVSDVEAIYPSAKYRPRRH